MAAYAAWLEEYTGGKPEHDEVVKRATAAVCRAQATEFEAHALRALGMAGIARAKPLSKALQVWAATGLSYKDWICEAICAQTCQVTGGQAGAAAKPEASAAASIAL